MPKRNRRNRNRDPAADASLVRGPGPTRGRSVPQRNYISTHLGGVPQHTRNVLLYAQAFSSATVAASYNELSAIKCNGPFLPYTGAALQPVGYAKMMAFYSKCFVTGARVKAHITNCQSAALTGAAVPPVIYGLTITTDATAIGSYNQAIGSGLTTFKLVGSSPDTVTLSMSVDIGKYLDKPDVLDDPQLFCTASANPGQIVCVHPWWSNAGLTAGAFMMYLTVEYDCIFTDPIVFS